MFHSALSIEKEASAHETLRLRAFYRQFTQNTVPNDYYRLLRGEITLRDLYNAHPDEAKHAHEEAWCAELGGNAVQEVRTRIRASLGDTDPWVLLGGPPCQPFSLAGRSRNRSGTQYSGNRETRHQLYIEYLQIIADFWPAVFVMENVRGLLSAMYRGVRMFSRIAEDLQDPDTAIKQIPGRGRARSGARYNYHLYPIAPRSGNSGNGLFGEYEDLHDFLVCCERHNVPQARHRVILIGVRDDIIAKPELLPTQDPVAVRKVLEGLPELRSGLSRGDNETEWRNHVKSSLRERWAMQLRHDDPATYKEIRTAIRNLVNNGNDRGGSFLRTSLKISHAPEWYLADRRLGGLCNHQSRSHMPSDLHRYLFAACFAKAHRRSPGLSDFPGQLLPDHTSVEKALNGGHFADRFRVQLHDRPSTTIVSHIAKDGHYYIHPDPTQCRSLTVREAARLQTFPDDYFFVGNRTQQYTQVGNAVPPLLAVQIAGVVYGLLSRAGNG